MVKVSYVLLESYIYFRVTGLVESYTVFKSRVEISHKLMEISLNLMGFTDLF